MVAKNIALLENWIVSFFHMGRGSVRPVLGNATQFGQMLIIFLLHLLVKCHCMTQTAEVKVGRHLQALVMEIDKEQGVLLLYTISTPKPSFYYTLFDFSVL